MLKGIDVSQYQSVIDWDKVKGQIDFAILRCGYGDNLPYQDDIRYIRNAEECERLGIPYAVYIYSYALRLKGEASIENETSHVLRLLTKRKPFCVYIDMEDGSTAGVGKTALTQFAETFCESVKKAGFKVGIYANENWFKNHLDVKFLHDKGYSIWAAKYSLFKPDIASPYDIWQYSSSGSISGIKGRVDLNYMYNDIRDLKPTTYENTPVNVYYKVRTNGMWLPEVKNKEDYAGIQGQAITDVAIRTDKGSVKYRVHIKGGGWLPYVTGYDTGDSNNGYAGNGRPIDAVEVYYFTSDNIRPYKSAYYRVSPIGGVYYDWQRDNDKSNGMDGYAGLFGNLTDKFQIEIKE